MGGILQVDTIQNNNTSALITQTNSTTITIGTTGQTISLAGGASSSGFGATYNSGLNWTSTLVTSALTVSSGTGYFVNTSTAAITVTLPASPTFGSIIGIADYSGYASTNNIIINPNGNKLEGVVVNKRLTTDKESVILNYVDSTRGWLPTSGVNNGSDALITPSYSIDFLVVAGGGGSGGDLAGGGGGAGGFRTSTQTVNQGTVITVTVGDGGAGALISTDASNGIDSSISGSGLTTITSAGGGGGGNNEPSPSMNGKNGGSGGGGAIQNGTGGSGNTPSTSPSQGNNGGNTGVTSGDNNGVGGGGGGAGANGQTSPNNTTAGAGGAGTASSITGSSVTYAGGGGGGARGSATAGGGGSGGGGAGANNGGTGTAGTVNTGGGAGGSSGSTGASGGKGVVILSMLTTKYSGTSTGSPTVTTKNAGADTVLTFTGSGSYTV
jgi:hypothetical protein